MFQLVSVAAHNKGASWIVGKAPIVLGRDAGADIVLEEPVASRRHGRVFLKDRQVHYEDCLLYTSPSPRD